MKTTTLPLKQSLNLSPVRLALLLIPLAFACFALSLQARAACQEGCDQTHYSTFLGEGALGNNAVGYSDTATGAYALLSNTSGSYNTAAGFSALSDNTTGGNNTANGYSALFYNTTGGSNTAEGYQALRNNTTGSNNIALGKGAGSNLTTGSNNIEIGSAGVAAEANTIRHAQKGYGCRAVCSMWHLRAHVQGTRANCLRRG